MGEIPLRATVPRSGEAVPKGARFLRLQSAPKFKRIARPKQWAHRDLNPERSRYERGALTIELWARLEP